MPRVSVIMPCFNDGQYIIDSIESVKKQTFKDWELIIVDDGSKDKNTLNILNSIRDERIKIYFSDNHGPSYARNIGIKKAVSEYILPLDSDDLIAPTYIQKAVEILDFNPQIGIVYCKARLFGLLDEKWELPDYDINEMLYNNLIFVTALYRKSDWRIVGGYDERLKYGVEDYDFWLSLIELEREVYCINEELFYYRIKKKSRNNIFFNNIDNVLSTYNIIYKKHERLYSNNLVEVLNIYKKKQLEIENKLDVIKKKIPFYDFILKHNKLKKMIKSMLK